MTHVVEGGIPDILCHFHKYHHLLPRKKSVNKQRRHLINSRAVNVLYVFVPEKEAAQFDSELLLGTRMVATCLRALMMVLELLNLERDMRHFFNVCVG